MQQLFEDLASALALELPVLERALQGVSECLRGRLGPDDFGTVLGAEPWIRGLLDIAGTSGSGVRRRPPMAASELVLEFRTLGIPVAGARLLSGCLLARFERSLPESLLGRVLDRLPVLDPRYWDGVMRGGLRQAP